MNRAWFSVFVVLFCAFTANAEKSEIEKRIEFWERTMPQYVPPAPKTPTPVKMTTPAPYKPVYHPPAPVPPPAEPAESILRNPSTYKQEQSNWCWAAVTQSIASTVGAGKFRQCEMASRFIASDTVNNICCGPRASDNICNKGYYTSEAMSTYGVLKKSHNFALDQSKLAQEFKAGNPVAISVVYSPTHAHALMLYGVANDRLLGEVVYGFDPDVLGKFVKARSEVERNRDYRWESTYTSSNPRK